MALFKNVGSILKRNIIQNCVWSMLNSARCMSTKLFVTGFSYSIDDNALRHAFSQHGKVLDAMVIRNKETGMSRGFGFVEFSDSKSANTAIESMDGQELHGYYIHVNLANKPHSDRPSDRPSAPRDGRRGHIGPYTGGSGSGYGPNAAGGGGFLRPGFVGGSDVF